MNLKNRTVGFPISRKENERRRALVPDDIAKIKGKNNLCFEYGYFKEFGMSDLAIEKMGCSVASFDEILSCDVICDPKIGDAQYLSSLKEGQIIFGWIHATQNRDITDSILISKCDAYAWENMYEFGRHTFYKNNEIAGEAAIMHSMTLTGTLPTGKSVAVIGNGNIARGAVRILTLLGANVSVYTRKLEDAFRQEFEQFDIIVNCVLWDTSRKDHLIYADELKKMRKDALIVDISCDRCGAIESSIPTSIESPVYMVDGVMHYVVDHTPSILYKSASVSISNEVSKFLDAFIYREEDKSDVLAKSLIIKDGTIIDKRISEFQHR